jgi:YesN/AraC family two-component response regulator
MAPARLGTPAGRLARGHGTYIGGRRSLDAMAQSFTVLIVDDDELVRDTLVGIVELKGLRVLSASSAIEAMRIIAQEPVDLLFTDIVMPHQTGIELAREAKKLRPDIQVMFATGYYSRVKEAHELGTLLYKPIRAHEIEAELDRFLRPRGGVPLR